MTDPIDHNRRAWDDRARLRRRFTRPLTQQDITDPQNAIDPWAAAHGVRGRPVLCLGAGGGRQSVLYALAGGIVTVVDISDHQLELDRQAAAQRGLDIRAVPASIDDLSPLPDAAFDIVIQPVSTCYVPDIAKVYRQVARVIRPGGLYLSQHKQPASMQADTRRSPRGHYELTQSYYRTGPLPDVTGSLHREPGTLEFLHRWDQIIGSMCRAGFTLEDLTEPHHADPAAKPNSFPDRSRFLPPYVRLKARRTTTHPPTPSPQIISTV